MFRDLKEYQEIAKIYADKVSKSEELDEMTGGLGVQGAQKMQKDIKSGDLKQKPVMEKKPKEKTFIEKGGALGAIKRLGSKVGNALKTKPIVRKPGNTSVRTRGGGVSTGGKNTSKIDTSNEIESSEAEFKANEGGKVNQRFKKDVQIVRNSKMSGKERAQAMAKKRIADKKAGTYEKPKTAQELAKDRIAAKKAGTSSPQLSGREKAQAMAKERIAAKKRLSDANIKVEDYTPYDIVLEYLLSSEQAATIEEANYIMTEMDAKTIQDIVS